MEDNYFTLKTKKVGGASFSEFIFYGKFAYFLNIYCDIISSSSTSYYNYCAIHFGDADGIDYQLVRRRINLENRIERHTD